MFTKSKLNTTDKLIIGLAIIALFFSFTARFNFPFTRLFGSIWNFGHVIAFFIWTYLCLRFIAPIKKLDLKNQFLVLLIATIIFGGFMELAQFAIGRSAQIDDIVSDLLGTSLAILFFSNRASDIKKNIKAILLVLVISLILIHHKNILFVPINDYYTYKQFPVLINPHSPFEITKLEAKKIHSIEIKQKDNKKYFEIEFSDAKYSTVMMGFFPLEWHDFSYLIIRSYNPSLESFNVQIRVHDLIHIDNRFSFEDRFSQTYKIKPGENTIKISIDEIMNAPASRQMDLSKMASIGLFTNDAKQRNKLYLYKIELIK